MTDGDEEEIDTEEREGNGGKDEKEGWGRKSEEWET